jgi:hypothetical protein
MKEIDISQISAVQFKAADLLTAGYIQFSFLEGAETKRGIRDAVRDENSILFKKQAQPEFERAKRLIDEYRERLRGAAVTTRASSPLEDLERLANLRDRGVLTDEEFETKKRQLLS